MNELIGFFTLEELSFFIELVHGEKHSPATEVNTYLDVLHVEGTEYYDDKVASLQTKWLVELDAFQAKAKKLPFVHSMSFADWAHSYWREGTSEHQLIESYAQALLGSKRRPMFDLGERINNIISENRHLSPIQLSLLIDEKVPQADDLKAISD
ncbi:hypothetical protein [Paenibacillus sp. R14(2021)]|uniref:hypothetical protein n=1 Tax=Paenibacillus sp. R14(2021) TaxID=2859228 RepID=UPI001C6162C9|nr:hypothetical protein [Paenibacillus sp. R14(2021)]